MVSAVCQNDVDWKEIIRHRNAVRTLPVSALTKTTSGNTNNTTSKNGHLVLSIFKKKQENDGVSDISFLFQMSKQ